METALPGTFRLCSSRSIRGLSRKSAHSQTNDRDHPEGNGNREHDDPQPQHVRGSSGMESVRQFRLVCMNFSHIDTDERTSA